MNVEIITIGDELLIGQVIDTNSAWLGKELNSSGFDVQQKTTISDNKKQIINALDSSLSRSQIVLITGGLGPTKDDITKKTLCEYFKSQMVFNKDVFEDIKDFLNSEDQGVNHLNRDQALVPADCYIIRNPVGTAPTLCFEVDNKIVISMPGVPYEMKAAVKSGVLPFLKKKFSTTTILHKTVTITDIPESDIAIKIKTWEDNLPKYVKLAYLPSPMKVRLRLTGKGRPIEEMAEKLELLVISLKEIVGEALWSLNDVKSEIILGELLKTKSLILSCAESCTGGNIAHKVTKVSGSSSYFYGGVVAYDNSIKENVLGVNIDDLNEFGAVSKPVVEQMALGVKKLMKTDWAVATSGIAGPTGGTIDKPVGTVWIAWAGPDGVESKKFLYGKLREQNIISSTESALVGLITRLES